MTKQIDYSNGKIYYIYDKRNEKRIYVGSTAFELEYRWDLHRLARWARGKEDRKLYEIMKKDGIDNFEIRLIENYPCNTKGELEQREAYWIKEHGGLGMLRAGTKYIPEEQGGDLVNIYIPGGKYGHLGEPKTDERRAYDRIKRVAAYQRNKHDENEKEKTRVLAAKYYENNTEKCNEKKRDKYESNAEYRNSANDRSKAVNASDFICEHCGGKFKGGARYRHLKPHKNGDKIVPPRCPKLK